jgi:hypothetical protein
MPLYPPSPENFHVVGVQILPENRIELAWDLYTNASLRDDYMMFNEEHNFFCNVWGNPQRLFAHLRSVVGYELWRNLSNDFLPPDEGILVANETNLPQGVLSYIDTDTLPNREYWYKLAAKIAE